MKVVVEYWSGDKLYRFINGYEREYKYNPYPPSLVLTLIVIYKTRSEDQCYDKIIRLLLVMLIKKV